MTITTTLKALRKEGACFDGYNKLVAALSGREFVAGKKAYSRFKHLDTISMVYILESNGIDDALWALRASTATDRDCRMFAVWCAREVQDLMTDPRSISALDVAEHFANGDATESELAAAGDAARDAARAAARAAAGDAARAAAWDAARAAAWAAAGEVARDAAWAEAWEAAWEAAGAAAWAAAGDAALAAAEEAVLAEAREAAREAARAAAGARSRDAQSEMFILMCEGKAPWQTGVKK